jgi:general secretion pathway protein A
MYTAFYDLREKPFSLTPDPRFLFLAGSHREALAHVLYGIDQGEGFIAVTGEVGTGKTTLCRTLLQRLGPDTEVAFLFNPTLSPEELLRAISIEYGIEDPGHSRAGLNHQLNQFLLAQKRAGRRVLLIVDEAQNLETSTLEEIRLLSNLETTTSKLIQILLFGQPELDAKLESEELRQLRQRISVRWRLGAMTPAETREYVRHRVRVANGGDLEIFTARALREVHRRSRGIPRIVNLLCDRSLLAGYAAGQRVIGPDLVGDAAREILGARRLDRKRRMVWRRGAAAAVLLAALAVSALAWQRLAPRDTSLAAAVSAEPPSMGASASLDSFWEMLPAGDAGDSR